MNIEQLEETIKSQSKQIGNLRKRIKKLEQAQTYFPMTAEELAKEKIGGTD